MPVAQKEGGTLKFQSSLPLSVLGYNLSNFTVVSAT